MDALPLMEAFYTLQGEGFHQGKAAVFIRLAGCDVGCHWCDVKESWNAEVWPVTSTDDIVHRIETCPSKSVVVTEMSTSFNAGNCTDTEVNGICAYPLCSVKIPELKVISV